MLNRERTMLLYFMDTAVFAKNFQLHRCINVHIHKDIISVYLTLLFQLHLTCFCSLEQKLFNCSICFPSCL